MPGDTSVVTFPKLAQHFLRAARGNAEDGAATDSLRRVVASAVRVSAAKERHP